MVVVINGTDGISTPDVVVDSIGTDTSTAVAIRTNGVERMRVDASGQVLVGGSSPVETFAGLTTVQGVGNNIFMNQRNTTGFVNHFRFYNPNGAVGAISTSSSSTSYGTTSDYRLKENVAPITDAAERLLALNPVRFNFIADPDTTVDGFLAHEAQAVVPEAVTGEKDGEEMQGIDQSKLVPLLTAALQEALQKIEALEARISALETPA